MIDKHLSDLLVNAVDSNKTAEIDLQKGIAILLKMKTLRFLLKASEG